MDENIVHPLPVDEPMTSVVEEITMKNAFIIFMLVIVMGVASGYGLSYLSGTQNGAKTNASGTKTMSGNNDVASSAGIADKKTFHDNAEGKLVDKTAKDPDEGSFKLIRPGGDSQTVYLTSSTVDMSEFVGKEVRVYGETFASDKVGWLMDVGFIEVKK